MGADTRFAVVVFGALVLWLPALVAVLRGDLDAGSAAIRFGMGAALVWVMVAALNQLVTGYAVATTDGPGDRAADGRGDGATSGVVPAADPPVPETPPGD